MNEDESLKLRLRVWHAMVLGVVIAFVSGLLWHRIWTGPRPDPQIAGGGEVTWVCWKTPATVTPNIIPIEVYSGTFLIVATNGDRVCAKPGWEGR